MSDTNKPNFNVFVFSLPRSGSSMMTGICQRLGVDIQYTTEDAEEVKKRAERERKRYRSKYKMNPKFYEISRNPFMHWVKIHSSTYAGAKVIIPVNGMRWDAVTAKPAKVILMWRDPSEIRQSQEASYRRARASYTGPEDKEPWEHAEAHLRMLAANTEMQLKAQALRSNRARFNDTDVQPFDYMVVKYRDVLADPKKEITKIANWIQADPELIDYAISSVDATQIRFKKEELSEGV